jgi:hypothetical protein
MTSGILLGSWWSLALPLLCAQGPREQRFEPVIPRAWDDQTFSGTELPLAGLGQPATHVTAEYYYRIPIRPVYKTYPVYHPDREPAGYWKWLHSQEPEMVFDPKKLHTEADWISAGELIFKGAGDLAGDTENVRDAKWYQQLGILLAPDGSDPSARYIVTSKGHLEIRYTNCSSCHTRVLPDGKVIVGAQGSPPVGLFDALNIRRQLGTARSEEEALQAAIVSYKRMFTVPWLQPDPVQPMEAMSPRDLLTALETIPRGVVHRGRTSLFFPPKTPDLIGVKDRKYLDATGLVRHRSMSELMRYAAAVDGTEELAAFGPFRMADTLPDPATRLRFSDEQLYALALYIYALKPPPNPNSRTPLTARGEQVFKREGCAGCHTPPLYTNNSLTPVDGFAVPEAHTRLYAVLPISVGTDPRLALQTRKGTGYYRVPSLKGVWYRGPFEHNGSVATLEDWFDPARLREDYTPTAFKGFGVETRPVRGHEFGLKIPAADKEALIAFLKTL